MRALERPLLEVRGLEKRYGRGCPDCVRLTGPEFGRNQCPSCGCVVACCDVGFSVHSSEVLGVVGESGSGKSTIVKALHFDMEVDGGEAYIDAGERGEALGISGRDVLKLSPFKKRQLRNALMGVVYQHPHLGLRMNVSAGGNIAERLLMAGWRNVGAMRERASTLLSRTEVPAARMDEAPKRFSGGMQQRVQIAKALSNEPALLLLDEISTGLDVSVQAKVLDLVRRLQGELGVAALVVSHDLGVIRMLAARTMVMKNGRVVESGLTDQILEDPQHPYTQLLVSSALR